MQAFSLQSSLSSPRLLHQSSAPSSGLATPQPLERNHSTGLQLQRSGGDSDQVCNHAAYTCALATTAIMEIGLSQAVDVKTYAPESSC